MLRDLLRVIADNLKQRETGGVGIFGRAVEEESLLNQKVQSVMVSDLPEKLITQSMMVKKEAGIHQDSTPSNLGLGELFKLST